MTREMNKPEEEEKPKPRTLNPDVAEFVESLNRSLGKCG